MWTEAVQAPFTNCVDQKKKKEENKSPQKTQN